MSTISLKGGSGSGGGFIGVNGADKIQVAENGDLTVLSGKFRAPANAIAFHAEKSTSPAYPAATWSKIAFAEEIFDLGGYYDSATNYRWSPQVAGYYMVELCVQVTTGTANYTYASIYKNGAEYKTGAMYGAGTQSPNVAALIYLNGSTDYIEGYIYSPNTPTLTPSGARNFFCGHLWAAA